MQAIFREDSLPPLELWAGAEYTCNRVGDTWFDQMALSGHAERHSDVAALAALGLRTLRCGLLWERHALQPGWSWSDRRMLALRQHGIDPIVGLVHHGSGPPGTDLLDPEFPHQLATYARQVAERYPWVTRYTPVNEPHTTARFSAAYGLWYPRHRSRESYLRALLHQLKATVLSMQAIRAVQPAARLVQTDDVGDISGTPGLRPQWELLNERQWLPFDLLFGRVDRHHPLYAYLLQHGIGAAELDWFGQHPCPPDVLGINYYPTSNRWIDDRTGLYPAERGSCEGQFVDVEAVRVSEAPEHHLGTLLRRAWHRYSTPLVVTEVHLGGPAEDQIRWLADAWHHATQARRAGVGCTALTIWAAFGSFFWNELVTRDNGHYEPGLFDIRSGSPVPTELAAFVSHLASGVGTQHPALATAGWWKCPDRFCFPAHPARELAA